MWEPFTERARRSIVIAQELAQIFGNNFVDADHIFAAVVQEGHNGASNAVASFGVSDAQVAAAAKDVISAANIQNSGEMNFTPRAKSLIDLAFQEARDLQNTHITVEHLMLGYLREFKRGSALLTMLELQPGQLRAKILSGLKSGAKAPAPTSLDEFFERAASSIPIGELWQRLQNAVEFEDVGAALMYALLIGRRSGLSSGDTAKRLQKLLDEFPD